MNDGENGIWKTFRNIAHTIGKPCILVTPEGVQGLYCMKMMFLVLRLLLPRKEIGCLLFEVL